MYHYSILKNTTFQQIWPGTVTENHHGAWLRWQFIVGDTRQEALMGPCMLLCASRTAQASPALCCAGMCSQAVGRLWSSACQRKSAAQLLLWGCSPPLHHLPQQPPAWGENLSKTHLSIRCNNAKHGFFSLRIIVNSTYLSSLVWKRSTPALPAGDCLTVFS